MVEHEVFKLIIILLAAQFSASLVNGKALPMVDHDLSPHSWQLSFELVWSMVKRLIKNYAAMLSVDINM